MERVLYDSVVWERGFCGVREDKEPYGRRQDVLTEEEELYGTEEQLYADILAHLSKEYLLEKYSLCLQIRDGDDGVVYEFPRVACPGLILEQLKLRKP